MNPALRRTLQVSAWVLALALVALPLVAVVNGWVGSERWALRTLRVNDGLERVDQARLRDTVLPFAQRGFFAIPLADTRLAVERLPWVERAEVRKRWPDVLEVVIVEHRPFARWGEEQLLSEQGRLFPAAGIELPHGLPLLHGPEARVDDVIALYNESRALFASTGSDVRSVVLDPRGSWSLRLGSGTEVVVGSHEARLRLRRFARMLPQVMARNPLPLQRADLRYTNGFALTWGVASSSIPQSGEGRDDAATSSQYARLAVPVRTSTRSPMRPVSSGRAASSQQETA